MVKHDLFVYDLGKLWLDFTGLPFVFALWFVTREAVVRKREEIKSLSERLLAAKRHAYDSYGSIADNCKERDWIRREALVDYWRTISYDLTPRHLQGISTFFRYAQELQILPQAPEIEIFS